MKIVFSNRAEKELKDLDKSIKQRIKYGICNLPSGDVKRLQAKQEIYRLRVGRWRINFSYVTTQTKNDTILIEKIAPRGQAYKE